MTPVPEGEDAGDRTVISEPPLPDARGAEVPAVARSVVLDSSDTTDPNPTLPLSPGFGYVNGAPPERLRTPTQTARLGVGRWTGRRFQVSALQSVLADRGIPPWPAGSRPRCSAKRSRRPRSAPPAATSCGGHGAGGDDHHPAAPAPARRRAASGPRRARGRPPGRPGGGRRAPHPAPPGRAPRAPRRQAGDARERGSPRPPPVVERKAPAPAAKKPAKKGWVDPFGQ
jgi:hypothetical protein